jgi:hypothetical protein
MDGRCFMCATPHTFNSLQVKCTRQIKRHLQNLQQFQSKMRNKLVHGVKEKQKTSCIDFDVDVQGSGNQR